MTDSLIPAARDAVEAAVAAVLGVRVLYPVSVLPGAERVRLAERGGVLRCELRIATDASVPVGRVVLAAAAAARRALDRDDALVVLEVASIE